MLILDVKIPLSFTYNQLSNPCHSLKISLPNLQTFIYSPPKDILLNYMIPSPSIFLNGSTSPNNGMQTPQHIVSCFLNAPLWKKQLYQSETSKEDFI